MTAVACIGEPISWLRLEMFALAPDATDGATAAHVAACPACSRCLTEIRDSSIDLPRLILPVVTATAQPRRWLRWFVPAMAAAVAAAAIALVVVRPKPTTELELREDVVTVKGVGEVILGTVRERGGTIREDMPSFAPGDRWKVVVTCPPTASAWIDVAVVDPSGTDYPLAPAHVTCGNRVVVPGAFTVTGTSANRVCVRVDAGTAPLRVPPRPRDPNVACVTLRPE